MGAFSHARKVALGGSAMALRHRVSSRRPRSARRLVCLGPMMIRTYEHGIIMIRTEIRFYLSTQVHACGSLTDLVLSLAANVSAPVAVLPCCHSLGRRPNRNESPLNVVLDADPRVARVMAVGLADGIDDYREDQMQARGSLLSFQND